jgi:large subunit ribosomal protein L3
MPKIHRPRCGSLEFWPRKRARKILPSVNWTNLEQKKFNIKLPILGFIGYKAGMLSCLVRDSTPFSLTKGKQIVLPVSVIECPPMKVLAVRFYKGPAVKFDVLAPDLDKELKRDLKLPKKQSAKIEDFEPKLKECDNIRLLFYTVVKKTGLKKTPDISEIGLQGTLEEKFAAAKSLLGKEINISDVLDKGQLVDVHAVTKAKGFAGPVKRFGISLKAHKSEKGIRRPGTLGPWTPHRVSFRAPLAGQLGFFTRVQYNNKIIDLDKAENLAVKEFPHYGIIKTAYVFTKGSMGGAQKRQIMLTLAARPTKKTARENFEFIKIIN